MTNAIYPGSFDPVTNGHLDIVGRAAPLFDELIISVYDVPQKQLMFSVEERVELMKKAVANLANIRVVSYSGLTIAFAREMNARVIVRGLRMISDFEREFEMALMNKKLAPDIELVCLMTSLEYQFISSSLLKEACQLGGDISNLVPKHVADALVEKFGLANK
ncbi:MAG: pantetheine-phosphate adenylyltransferase [Dehalococcoidia bacterium]|nr:MAG: pantetheine-phosphate adenylyltransferase [Dehalococcoidia bacterium]UCG84034.1 MAG: pantetheine-phosphate adenylyltransferase [Dehalococcoidia bacterium]